MVHILRSPTWIVMAAPQTVARAYLADGTIGAAVGLRRVVGEMIDARVPERASWRHVRPPTRRPSTRVVPRIMFDAAFAASRHVDNPGRGLAVMIRAIRVCRVAHDGPWDDPEFATWHSLCERARRSGNPGEMAQAVHMAPVWANVDRVYETYLDRIRS